MEKQRLRFSVSDDICLIKEVLCENPFENNEKWKSIQEKVNLETNKMFSARCLKEHVYHLMNSFRKEENFNKKRSGTEEELTDLKVLLQNVTDLSNEFKRTSSCMKYFNNNSRKGLNTGILSRNESVVFSQLNAGLDEPLMNCMDYLEDGVVEIDLPVSNSVMANESQAVEDQGPVVAQRSVPIPSNMGKKRNNMFEYLREKQKFEQAMKREEIEIQSKKLRLEEATIELEKEKLQLEKAKLEFENKKFNFESQEREERLKLEMEERRERLEGEREQRQMLLEIFKSTIVKNV